MHSPHHPHSPPTHHPHTHLPPIHHPHTHLPPTLHPHLPPTHTLTPPTTLNLPTHSPHTHHPHSTHPPPSHPPPSLPTTHTPTTSHSQLVKHQVQQLICLKVHISATQTLKEQFHDGRSNIFTSSDFVKRIPCTFNRKSLGFLFGHVLLTLQEAFYMYMHG